MTTAPETDESRATSHVDDLARRLLAQRQVMVTGEITDALAAMVCSELLLLDAEASTEITMYVNSPGGSVDAGFAVYDTMNSVRAPVSTVCLGLAASMGQFLLTGGEPGHRLAARHARILIHQPHGAVQGNASDIEIQAEQFEYLRRKTAEITAAHTGQTVERILADADRDCWFTAEAAVDYGLVDGIVGQLGEA